jgi:outer membrane protein TolC
MSQILPIAGIALALFSSAYAQAPPSPAPAVPLSLTLHDAMERAQKYSQQTFNANIDALLAHEDRVQAKASLLPAVNGFSQYIYTQGNHTPTGIFVPNDGVHVYTNTLSAHVDLYAPAKLADYHKAIAAEAAARARRDLAARGLIATVMEGYYTMAVAARKVRNAELAVADAESFLDVTEKLEKGGEAAHSDTVKARLLANDRRRDRQEAQLAFEKARIEFAVLLFPDYQTNYTVVDDLDALAALPGYSDVQALAGKNSPDIRAAQAVVTQQDFEVRSAKADRLPAISGDYFFGMSANQFAFEDPEGHRLVGSVAQVQMNVPIWTWGAARSRVKQAEYKLQQAKNDLTYTQRNLLAELDAFYREAAQSREQLDSLRESVALAKQSLDLTLLRYQAGEVSVLEVVDAQTSARDARNAMDDGLARYRVAIGNLQTLTGAF